MALLREGPATGGQAGGLGSREGALPYTALPDRDNNVAPTGQRARSFDPDDAQLKRLQVEGVGGGVGGVVNEFVEGGGGGERF